MLKRGEDAEFEVSQESAKDNTGDMHLEPFIVHPTLDSEGISKVLRMEAMLPIVSATSEQPQKALSFLEAVLTRDGDGVEQPKECGLRQR